MALSLTQHQLAQALGVTPQHISSLEKDRRIPSFSSLIKMARELGVTTDFLLAGKEGIVTDTISAIKADRRLELKTKRALIVLVEELYRVTTDKDNVSPAD